MTNSFLTLEDINGAIQSHSVKVHYHEIDTSKIGDTDFTDVKYDFCTITRIYRNNKYNFYVTVNNDLWTGGYYVLKTNHEILSSTDGYDDGVLYINANQEPCIIIGLVLQSGYEFDDMKITKKWLDSNIVPITLNELNTSKSIRVLHFQNGEEETYSLECDMIGVKEITLHRINAIIVLIKTDFQFTCNQELIVGKVNKVALGTNAKYKPSGAMIGNNTPNITVEYNNNIIPVVWSESDNDYIFNIDLTTKQNEGNVRFKVIVEDNQVINKTETYVSLHCSYEAINTISKLTTLFTNGGIGRITSNLTLTDDLTLSKSVYLISDGKTLTMDSHKIIVPSDKTFKATNVNFTGGANTIQQNINTKVELTQCTFTDCTGLGSVIDCQIDINSLNNEDDFTTIINNCTFTNNDLCILHGGDLTITDCTVNGKISDKDYPYFLYQTDGRAVILQSQFNISSNSQITSDIGFNPCIFTCGETALINGHSHTELQVNNLTSFLETQRNTSSIDLTYKYSLINDYIRLKTSKGFCHNVSGIDYVFKTNVTPERI